MRKLLICVIFILWASAAWAADATLAWEVSEGSTGYTIYKSLDNGATWDVGIDVGNVTSYLYTGIEETGLVLFRVSAYNSSDETINYWSGAWFNYLWKPPLPAQGLGIREII